MDGILLLIDAIIVSGMDTVEKIDNESNYNTNYCSYNTGWGEQALSLL